MTLTEYVAAVRAGRIAIPAGSMVQGVIGEQVGAPLHTHDSASLTSEAFNQGVFGDASGITWDDALRQVQAAFAAEGTDAESAES